MKRIGRRDFNSMALYGAAAATVMAFTKTGAAQGAQGASGMEKRRLGNMDCTLTGLGLGKLGMDGYPAAERLIHTALDVGINFFDTAQVYGPLPATGEYKSEESLGQALVGRRKQAYVATKCGFADDGLPVKLIGFSPDSLETQCDKSLRKLRTDYIDLYQLHLRSDPKVPIEDVLGALGRLVEKGKVRFIGTTNNNGQMLKEHDAAAKKAGTPRFISTQVELSLLTRGPVTSLIPTLDELDIGLIAITPLADGFLTGRYKPGEPPPAGLKEMMPGLLARRLTEKNFKIIQALDTWARDHGHTLLDLAFAYVATHKRVVSIIAGASKPEQVVQNAKATEWKLTASQVAEVTQLAASFDERGLPAKSGAP